MIDLKAILDQEHETVNIEVKSAQGGLPKSIWETYASFANTFGGMIILGVGEDASSKRFIPLGISEPDKMINDIWNNLNNKTKISTNILLQRQVYKINFEGKTFVIIEVPRASRKDKPVFLNGDMFSGTYKRCSEGDYLCDKEEVKAMIRDQSDVSPDSVVLDSVSLSALNEQSIASYRRKFNSYHASHFWNDLPQDEFLLKIGAARNGEADGLLHPTLAGLIFFGEFLSISQELPTYFLDYRETGNSAARWDNRVYSGDPSWSGNIYDFYFKIADQLTADIKRPFAIDGSLARIDDTPIHKGLRECLANALIHADYYGKHGIAIEKKKDEITFSNPGSFRIDIQEAIAGGISDARNPRIFNFFSLIGVGERSGTGICDVFNAWKENGYATPSIVEKNSPDRVTLTLDTRPKSSMNTKAPEEKLILDLLSTSPRLSTTQIATKIGVKVDTVKYYIKKLQKNGALERSGTSQKGFWIVK